MTRASTIFRPLVLFAVIVLGVLWVPLPSDGQRPAKVVRIGYLTPSAQPAAALGITIPRLLVGRADRVVE